MIQRIVLLKLKAPFATGKARAETAEYSRQILSALPGVISVDVGTSADDPGADTWDQSLILRFGFADEFEPFRLHPDHRAYVNNCLNPKLECNKAWNFIIP